MSIRRIWGTIEVARKLARTEKQYALYDRQALMPLRDSVGDAS